jgi:hypothetical protein
MFELQQFVQDFLPLSISQSQSGSSINDAAGKAIPGSLSERDMLLDQLYKDISRSRKNSFAFYSAPVRSSAGCPLSPAPSRKASESQAEGNEEEVEGDAIAEEIVPRLQCSQDLLKRLEQINHAFALDAASRRQKSPVPAASNKGKARQEDQTSPQPNTSLLSPPDVAGTSSGPRSSGGGSGRSSPASFISAEGGTDLGTEAEEFHEAMDRSKGQTGTVPEAKEEDGQASPVGEHAEQDGKSGSFEDLRWHSLLRMLYIYALLNPSIGYIQVRSPSLVLKGLTYC